MGSFRSGCTMLGPLCLIACASASSNIFWSPEYKPVVRDEASPPRSQSSFQEAEENTVEKATPQKKEDARGEETAVDDDDDRPNAEEPHHTPAIGGNALLESKGSESSGKESNDKGSKAQGTVDCEGEK